MGTRTHEKDADLPLYVRTRSQVSACSPTEWLPQASASPSVCEEHAGCWSFVAAAFNATVAADDCRWVHTGPIGPTSTPDPSVPRPLARPRDS